MHKDITKLIAQNIQILCDRLSLSQRQLAEVSGLNRTTINHILTCKKICNVETLAKIAEALEVHPTVLMDTRLHMVLMTGIAPIDTAIAEINNNLFKGKAAIKTIGKYFADDYALKYADKNLDDPFRLGPNFVEEMTSNGSSPVHAHSRIITAWITGNQIHTMLEVRRNSKEPKDPVADFIKPKNLFEIASVIDTWLITKKVREVESGAPLKIRRRLVKYLNRKYE